MIRPLALLGLAPVLLLGACFSFGPDVPPSLLTLDPAESPATGTVRAGSQSEALVVLEPEVAQKLAVTRLPVTNLAGNITYLKDAVWTDKPARLFRNLLAQTIAARGGPLVLREGDAGGKANSYLSGELIEFGAEAATNEVVVTYDAVRQLSGGRVQTRRFSARRPVIAIEPNEVGNALNQAANTVAGEVATWIAG